MGTAPKFIVPDIFHVTKISVTTEIYDAKSKVKSGHTLEKRVENFTSIFLTFKDKDMFI
jgi:hypothetical protein